MNLFLDCEWFIPQKLFLIGWCNNTRSFGQLYGNKLTRSNMIDLLKGVDFIFFYGPDIAVIENWFSMNIRNRFQCVNLLKCFRDHIPAESYKLAELEKKFGIHRNVDKYKRNMRLLYDDWHHPERKYHVLQYNMDDVINLYRLTGIIFKKYGIRKRYLSNNLLK